MNYIGNVTERLYASAYDNYGAATRSAAGKSDLPVDDTGAQLPELVDEPVHPPCTYLMVFYDRIPFCGPNMFRARPETCQNFPFCHNRVSKVLRDERS